MQNYYLGLDMGTSTVGWAVTDENYQLLKKRGKDLWGVREFEEAKVAVERRTHRTDRRRRQREQVRVGLLKNYFDEAIKAVDPNFYARLENSKYHLEDKDEQVRTPNGIFADKNYKDKDYFKEYPTIFHLRHELIVNPEPHDVRLVFLALLNMFKHRGHFLNAGLSSEDAGKMTDAYGTLTELLENVLELSFKQIDAQELESILGSRDLSRSQKAEKINELLGIQKSQKQHIAIIKTICGLKTDARVLFNLEEAEKKIEIEFSSFGYEEKEPEIHAEIGDELFEVLSAMKAIFDIGSLAGILHGNTYLCDSRIAEYNKHNEDLKLFKEVMKELAGKEAYNKMFRSEEDASYSAYVNSVSYSKLYDKTEHSKHRRNMSKRKRDEFYDAVLKIMKTLPESDARVQYIKDQIALETFLPKQLTASNGVIPYQVYEKEMKVILKNAKAYLPFLNDIDESGFSTADRILKLFSFQIPYYIGPLSENSQKNNGTGWVIRKEEGTVYPWNIKEKVDMKATSQEFISRMVRKCTYIKGEQVLPRESLMYERFCVLNEINNIKIHDERISPELKQEIYKELFEAHNKVTRSSLEKYLIGKGLITKSEELTGVDKQINNSLKSYRKFKEIFGNEIDTDAGKKMAEDIIFWCTIYGDSKSFLIENIQEKYPELTKAQIKRITGIKFKDWGNFSKTFFELQGCNPETGEKISLLQALWETNRNLMELLHDSTYMFDQSLLDYRDASIECFKNCGPEILDEYYFSAPVKKMIWQTLGIIDEIVSMLGQEPTKVFIEMTRHDDEKGDKGRKDSRKKQLLERYKSVKDDSRNWKELIEKSDENGTLRSKKMYLYLSQMGKDMYTGEVIDLENLFNNNIYDIDHIYPRHFVKDDSIHNNLVLVRKDANAHKSDTYPIESSIRHNTKITDHWYMLKEKNLISEEKYRRLTGKHEFSEEQKADFIARQLVETAQATKGAADILKRMIPDTEIVYAKAGNVSDFRKRYDLLKSRTVNDFHHAHDAYLNIVVGNVYHTKFTSNPRNFILKEYNSNQKANHYNLSKMFDWDVKRNGKVAWIAAKKDQEAGTIVTVKKTLAKNTPLITKALIEEKGQLFNIKPIGKAKANPKNYVPLKQTDEKLCQLQKYGGYTSLKPSYLMVVEHGKEGKRKRTFECVPVIYRESLNTDEKLIEYCQNKIGLINPKLIAKKVKLHSLLKLDGYYVRIVGIDSRGNIELHNAVSLCLCPNYINYVKHVENAIDRNEKSTLLSSEKNIEIYRDLIQKHKNSVFKKRPKALSDYLERQEKDFIKCKDIVEQSKLLLSALSLTKIGPSSGEVSRLRVSGNLTTRNEALLITQSKTGIFETAIDLLK